MAASGLYFIFISASQSTSYYRNEVEISEAKLALAGDFMGSYFFTDIK
tara:strand:+ start:7225 stop:7368 length:144 start_codon:yes stop_codon:yes gene_type:complete